MRVFGASRDGRAFVSAPAAPGQPRRARAAGMIAGVLSSLALGVAAACHDSSGGGGVVDLTAFVKHWNEIAINASGLDHMPSDQGAPHTFGENLGPCRASRAMAIVHIAIFEVVNAIEGGFQSYVGLAPAQPTASMRAAIGQAAYDTLSALFPSQTALFVPELDAELAAIPAGTAKDQGIALGQAAAQAILQMRTNDGSQLPEPLYGVDYIASDLPGKWRQDPISMVPLALGADWNQVAPFVMTSADQFRAPDPPAIDSPEYALAYDEEKVLGGDGVNTPTVRSDEQTFIGLYWGYDGTPSLCAPPRLYNQIAVQLATEQGLDVVELARLLALANVAMADAGLAVWESKYFYEYWRPVTAIRESDPGTGPTGLGDGNPLTVGDTTFTPLGAPASNAMGPNFTPPFPAYPSGHAGFGGALFQTLRRFFGTDDIAFTFVSDEFNGVTQDNQGNTRPLMPRAFGTLTEAEDENGQSRIYLGIHWKFDKEEGIQQGRNVGNFVFDNIFQPVP